MHDRPMQNPTQILLAEIEAFLDRHDMHPTCFGLGAINDGRVVFNMREGRDLRWKTQERIRAYMARVDAEKAGV